MAADRADRQAGLFCDKGGPGAKLGGQYEISRSKGTVPQERVCFSQEGCTGEKVRSRPGCDRLFLPSSEDPQHPADDLVVGAQLSLYRGIGGDQRSVDLYQQLVAAVARPGLVIGGAAIGILFYGVIIQCDGPAEYSLGAGHRKGMSVVGVRVRIEDNATIKNR